MKVCVHVPPHLSQAMHRIANALTRFAFPYVVIVPTWEDADVVLLHTIGAEAFDVVEHLHAQGKSVVIAQYCLQSTQRPTVAQWLPLWKSVLAVWSYYDLHALARAEGLTLDGVNFIHTPLGVEPTVFTPRMGEKPFMIATSGYVAASECVDEATEAAYRVGGKVFHLGPAGVAKGPHVTVGHSISDDALARRYSQCHYVAGLRRGEGFELPAAEGLHCGARPVMFDRPHYRQWFHGLAVFIPERGSEDVTRDLEAVFRDRWPVTEVDRAVAQTRFSWPVIAREVWGRVTRA